MDQQVPETRLADADIDVLRFTARLLGVSADIVILLKRETLLSIIHEVTTHESFSRMIRSLAERFFPIPVADDGPPPTVFEGRKSGTPPEDAAPAPNHVSSEVERVTTD